jgi:hypothetical protein
MARAIRHDPAFWRRCGAWLLTWAIAAAAGPAWSDASPDAGDVDVPTAAEPADAPEVPALDPKAINDRIREIEAALARDAETLKVWVAKGSDAGAAPFDQSPELRAIAGRMPRLQSELRELRQRAAALPAP